jgi:hypothetical protein
MGFLATPVDGSVKWYTTTAFIEHTGLWRASVNKTLKEYLDLGWVEQISIDSIPIVEKGEIGQHRRRNLWRLSDESIGLQFKVNTSLEGDLVNLGRLFYNEAGVDPEGQQIYPSPSIAEVIEELGSESILNFLNAFTANELYYQDAVDKLRGNGISCPKHDKLAKLCSVTFTRIAQDRELLKVLDREFTPDRSGGAPGYTYKMAVPGVEFEIFSSVSNFNPIIHVPRPEDWKNSQVTAEQISTLREGVVIG